MFSVCVFNIYLCAFKTSTHTHAKNIHFHNNLSTPHAAFVVKYEYAAKQRHLPLHTDQSTISLTIALNGQTQTQNPDDSNNSKATYEGGGTYFEAINETIVRYTLL
jgi:hypothetical protein